MSESKFAAVSSCLDNESRNEQDLKNIIDDTELADSWSRYQLIGDVLRDDVPDEIQLDLSQSIADALENEATVLAPVHRVSLGSKVKAKVIQFSKPFGQMAIAASAAGLMVFGVQNNNVETDIGAPVPSIQTSPFGGVASPVSYNVPTNQAVSKEQAFMQQQHRFQSLLLDHNHQVKVNARRDNALQVNEQNGAEVNSTELNSTQLKGH